MKLTPIDVQTLHRLKNNSDLVALLEKRLASYKDVLVTMTNIDQLKVYQGRAQECQELLSCIREGVAKPALVATKP